MYKFTSSLPVSSKPSIQGCYEGPYHDFNGITSKFGAHFILRVDKILMKKKYSDAIINGVRAQDFPSLPVDYGYRDSKNFWFHRKSRMRAELLQMRKASLESVRYAADRVDDVVKFTDEALQTVLGVPRVFLPLVLKGCWLTGIPHMTFMVNAINHPNRKGLKFFADALMETLREK